MIFFSSFMAVLYHFGVMQWIVWLLGKLMQKTLVAGIPMLAAVGAPSSLAVDTALEFGMTLVGFLRDVSFNTYAGGRRIG